MAQTVIKHDDGEEEVVEEAPPSPGRSIGRIILIILAILIVGAAVYFIFRKKPANNSSQDTADSIRNAFNNPPSDNSTSSTSTSPIFTPPAPTTGTPTPSFPPTTTTPPVAANPPRTNMPSYTAPRSSAPVAPRATTPAPAPTTYRNPAMGFEMTLPANWAIDNTASAGNRVVIVDRRNGSTVGFVEIYNNTSGETLDSLARIYQGSPSVTQVNNSSINGQPAIQFLSNQPDGNGLAFIYNGKIYYLRGALATSPSISNFRLI